MAEISVSMRNVKKVYPGSETPAIQDINLDIADAEFVVLVGHSGCGKSTILRIIAGLESPTEGEVFIGGQSCTHLEPKDRDIAMVFQNYALYPHFSVRENLEFGLKMARRLTRPEIETRVLEAAEILEIRNLLDRKPKHLSGGERQRVALGRAIVRKPRVFLFDEPLSNLDANMRAHMRIELGRLHSRLQTTMLYVTHDQVEAMTMGDRIICMRNGEIQQVGQPMELYSEPINEYVGSFIGTPPMNFTNGEFQDGGVVLQGTEVVLPVQAYEHLKDFKKFRVGVRPEHLILSRTDTAGIPCRVEVVETLGFETLLHVGNGKFSTIVRSQNKDLLQVGENVYLHISKPHFFDGATGQRIILSPLGE
ncbi:MAG: sn-glycerol-3-phosphate ABC transporter ATP-binding protein UgpC [Fibrobacter sp.]|nr:sn-glycerol-3-phosphate ABC transporter ATP-binding protein UgpC [Fibrobacter sp.]